MFIEVGLFGFILLAICIWAAVNVFQSQASIFGKVLWILALLLFPVFGFLAWLFFGPRSSH